MPRHRLAALLAACALAAPPAVAQNAAAPAAQVFPGYMNFGGRFLAVLSDADMVASAYMDGDIGPRSPTLRDELTLFPLVNGLPGPARRIPVSNAVTAWPTLLALSPDGRFAYVAETDTPPPAGATRMDGLRPSPMVRTVALDADLQGRVVQEVRTAGRAQGLAMHPRGELLAVNIINTARPQIGLLRVGTDGRLGGFVTADLPDVPAPPRDLSWSPDGEILAATFPNEHAARFYRVSLEGNRATVTQVGEPMITGKFAGMGRWSPDGRHFFVTNLYWFGGAADRYAGSNVSTLAAIRVDRTAAARHAVVSAAPAGASAENFAISPDGRTIVTLNMENSFLAPNDRRLTYHSSLTLMSWDPDREVLVTRSTLPFEGILPEGITFDRSGRFLAIANFAHANPQRALEQATVDFFRLTDGAVPMLVQMDMKLPVMRGAHVVMVQP